MRIAHAVVIFLFAGFAGVSQGLADVPPPYDPYGIGARLEEAIPFPKFVEVARGGPAEKAGLKAGDGVIAIDGRYSKGSAPFYFFARGLQGPENSTVDVVVLRDGSSVFVVRVKRTVAQR
ncbi:MAG: PDZ domain-containing protein [Alphaproteobacteria bacterium]|nr:PDZ domain-containing protein [Alphaproteobacteria bacterium]